MRLLSVNVGPVAPLFVTESGKTESVMTGIRKQAVVGPVLLKPLGLHGDERADLTVHGGLDKAVYAYRARIEEASAARARRYGREPDHARPA